MHKRDIESLQPVLINMDDFVYAGEGANGASYHHRTDPSVLLKIYEPEKSRQSIDEMALSRKVYRAGIPTPEPETFVTDGQRYGILFRRIPGKISFARAIGNNPGEVGAYAEEFAAMCRDLHAVHLDTEDFDSEKQLYFKLLEENPFFTTSEKDRIGRFIDDAPESDTALHGDLQFGNAIIAGDKRYFIDLGDFCYGYNLFDIGMVYLTGNLNIEEFTLRAFHMDNATAKQFWKAFAPAYFGQDRPLASIEEEVRPYAGLKTLIVERDTRRPMPEMRIALEPILK